MKAIKFLIIPIAASFLSIAHAGNLQSKVVNLPFFNEPIVSATHSGLYFTYDMSAGQKIVCESMNDYKSWMEYRFKGEYQESGIGTLTAKGLNDDARNQVSADVNGAVRISDQNNAQGRRGTASCHYEFDDNV